MLTGGTWLISDGGKCFFQWTKLEINDTLSLIQFMKYLQKVWAFHHFCLPPTVVCNQELLVMPTNVKHILKRGFKDQGLYSKAGMPKVYSVQRSASTPGNLLEQLISCTEGERPGDNWIQLPLALFDSLVSTLYKHCVVVSEQYKVLHFQWQFLPLPHP